MKQDFNQGLRYIHIQKGVGLLDFYSSLHIFFSITYAAINILICSNQNILVIINDPKLKSVPKGPC